MSKDKNEEKAIIAKPSISAEDFVRAWQKSASVKAVCDTLGISETAANSRARNYRKAGVQLKKMEGGQKGRKLDVSGLNTLAASLLEQPAEGSK